MKVSKLICTFALLVSGTFAFCADLPRGFGGVNLGSSLETTKENLKKNSDFGYNGDRDVSLLPGESRSLIETDASRWGNSFLDRCWFQFDNDRLFIITINVNTSRMDYYSMFTTLSEKYGKPSSLTPERAVWEDGSVTMSLEKPLTLKYVDSKVFKELQDKAGVEKSTAEKTREMFLDEL